MCLLRSGMAEIYFQNENLANILIQKSNTLSFAGTTVECKIVIKKALHKYVVYGLDLNLSNEEIQLELLDASGRLVEPATVTRL